MVYPRVISFIARSKRRSEILTLLSSGEKSQSEITKITKMYKAHTSRTIKELVDNKLIACKNPEDRSFKFYRISPLGKKAIKEVQRIIEDK